MKITQIVVKLSGTVLIENRHYENLVLLESQDNLHTNRAILKCIHFL